MWINNKWVEWKDEDNEPKKENSLDYTAINNCVNIAIDTHTIINDVKVNCHRLNKTKYYDENCRDLLVNLAKDRIEDHFKDFDKDIDDTINNIYETLRSNSKCHEHVVDSIKIEYDVKQVPGVHFTLLDIKDMFHNIEVKVNQLLKKYEGIFGEKDHPITKDLDVDKYIKLHVVFKTNTKSPDAMSSPKFVFYKYSSDIKNEKMVEEMKRCADLIIKHVEKINAAIADFKYLISHVELNGAFCNYNTKYIICKIQDMVNEDIRRFSSEFYKSDEKEEALTKTVDNIDKSTSKVKFPYDETPLPSNDDGKGYRLCKFKVIFYKNQPIVDTNQDEYMEFSNVDISCYIDKDEITKQTHKSANYIAMAIKYYLLKNDLKAYKFSVFQKEDNEFVKLVISKLHSTKEFTV